MLKGITKSGFNYEVTDERLDDYELIEALSEVDTNPILLPKVIKLLLGESQKNELIDHIKVLNGKVPMSKISEELLDIFNGTGKEIKNS